MKAKDVLPEEKFKESCPEQLKQAAVAKLCDNVNDMFRKILALEEAAKAVQGSKLLTIAVCGLINRGNSSFSTGEAESFLKTLTNLTERLTDDIQ